MDKHQKHFYFAIVAIVTVAAIAILLLNSNVTGKGFSFGGTIDSRIGTSSGNNLLGFPEGASCVGDSQCQSEVCINGICQTEFFGGCFDSDLQPGQTPIQFHSWGTGYSLNRPSLAFTPEVPGVARVPSRNLQESDFCSPYNSRLTETLKEYTCMNHEVLGLLINWTYTNCASRGKVCLTDSNGVGYCGNARTTDIGVINDGRIGEVEESGTIDTNPFAPALELSCPSQVNQDTPFRCSINLKNGAPGPFGAQFILRADTALYTSTNVPFNTVAPFSVASGGVNANTIINTFNSNPVQPGQIATFDLFAIGSPGTYDVYLSDVILVYGSGSTTQNLPIVGIESVTIVGTKTK